MAGRRGARAQFPKTGPSKLELRRAQKSRPMARIFGGIGSDFSRAASAIPSLKRGIGRACGGAAKAITQSEMGAATNNWIATQGGDGGSASRAYKNSENSDLDVLLGKVEMRK